MSDFLKVFIYGCICRFFSKYIKLIISGEYNFILFIYYMNIEYLYLMNFKLSKDI